MTITLRGFCFHDSWSGSKVKPRIVARSKVIDLKSDNHFFLPCNHCGSHAVTKGNVFYNKTWRNFSIKDTVYSSPQCSTCGHVFVPQWKYWFSPVKKYRIMTPQEYEYEKERLFQKVRA